MKILILEDDQKIGQFLKKGLTIEGYLTYLVTNGDDCLWNLEDYQPDLLILDLMVPGKDGLTILKEIRHKNIFIPVIILSAKSEIEDRVRGLYAGADDYLSKPFSFEELLARINALLRRPQIISNEILTFDDLSLNLSTFEVRRGEVKINLSKKEFQLLEFLIRNSNKIVSKDKIISNVWEFESDILPNTVEVFIGSLRNKIDKPFSKKIIKTIRGFGYRLGN